MKQESFSDMEYRCRKKKTKREEFLEIMDEIIPWDEWISLIVPYYPAGKRGRPPIEIEIMLRMYLLQCWFTLSDEGVEDAIYDSYAMRKFMGINFLEQDVPDATAGRSSVQEKMQAVGCQGRDVPDQPPVLVEGGAAQRGGVPDRQSQPGQSRLGGGLHHHPLLPLQCAGHFQRRALPEGRPNRILR